MDIQDLPIPEIRQRLLETCGLCEDQANPHCHELLHFSGFRDAKLAARMDEHGLGAYESAGSSVVGTELAKRRAEFLAGQAWKDKVAQCLTSEPAGTHANEAGITVAATGIMERFTDVFFLRHQIFTTPMPRTANYDADWGPSMVNVLANDVTRRAFSALEDAGLSHGGAYALLGRLIRGSVLAYQAVSPRHAAFVPNIKAVDEIVSDSQAMHALMKKRDRDLRETARQRETKTSGWRTR